MASGQWKCECSAFKAYQTILLAVAPRLKLYKQRESCQIILVILHHLFIVFFFITTVINY